VPRNKTDFATMLHDIQYLQTAGHPSLQTKADELAISNSGYDTPGFATTAGLRLRELFNFEFNKPTNGLTAEETNRVGDQMLTIVKQQPPYRDLFSYYGVNPDLYPNCLT